MDPYRPPTAIGPRNPDGTWTIAVDLCQCGAFAGECDCVAFHAQASTAPVIHVGQTPQARPPRRQLPATLHTTGATK